MEGFSKIFEIRDTSQNTVSLTLFINICMTNFHFKYKSTTFHLDQSRIYSSAMINFDIHIYHLLNKKNVDSTAHSLTKINVDSTAQNDLNLKFTFGVAPPCYLKCN